MIKKRTANIGRRCINLLKRILGIEIYTKYYYFYRKIISGYFILTNSVRRVFLRNLFKSKDTFYQKPLIWELPTQSFGNQNDFLAHLRKLGIVHQQGGFSIYIPPQKGLKVLLGSMVDFYPADAGYKIVKDFNSPDQANYLKDGVVVSWPEIVLAGNLFSQFKSACVAEYLELGPKVYDLVELIATNVRMSCFVVQNIDDVYPITNTDFKMFKRKLDFYIHNGVIGTAVPNNNDRHMDFSPPDCNKNLLKNAEGKLFYVDSQQLIILDYKKILIELFTKNPNILSFGDIHPFRGRNIYLYQSIPGLKIIGKRDTELRWNIITQMLTNSGINLEGRVILDICCNSGIFLSMALSKGAYWGIGWDIPEVVDVATKIQKVIGFSRINFIPAKLSTCYSILKDIDSKIIERLEGAIIFYLAAWNHIGLLKELSEIQWKALIFEGHEDRSVYSEVVKFMEEKCHARLVCQNTVRDGDSLPRQILLFIR